MNQLTNFYKNKCEQLEEQKNILLRQLNEIADASGGFNFSDWLQQRMAQQGQPAPAASEESASPKPPPQTSPLSGGMLNNPAYGSQATAIINALSDPNHPAHESAFMKHTLFSMLFGLGVHKNHIDTLKNMPHNRDFPSPGSTLY